MTTPASPYLARLNHLLQSLHHLRALVLLCPEARTLQLLETQMPQVLCEDTDERLILPEEDFRGQHKLAGVTEVTLLVPGDPSSPTGRHHQDVTAKRCIDPLGGDSHTIAVFCFGYHRWFTFHS